MDYDNPAARLLAILKNGKDIPASNNCRTAWQQLLGPVDSPALLMARMGKLMELPEQIITALKNDYPGQGNTWSHWEKQLSHAFATQDLNGQWHGFIGKIDEHSMTYLKLAADLLESRSTTKLIPDGEVAEIKQRIQALVDEVIASSVDADVKKFLVRYLRKIVVSIDEYFLTGALPVLESVETLLGHSAVDKTYLSFLKETELGEKILTVLGATANVVTVAVGLPELRHGFALLTHAVG